MKSALIIIDAQQQYAPEAEHGLSIDQIAWSEAIGGIKEAIQAARAADWPIYNVHQSPMLGAFEGIWGQDADDLSDISPDIPLYEKSAPSAMDAFRVDGTGPSLFVELLNLDIERLHLCGFQSHYCIQATAFAARDLRFAARNLGFAARDIGFAVTVLSDACASPDLPGISGEMMHEFAMAQMSQFDHIQLKKVEHLARLASA